MEDDNATALWRSDILLKRGKKGEFTEVPRPVVANAILILTQDERWRNVLAYDEFAETIVTTSAPPWRPCDARLETRPGDWQDDDTTRVQSWLSYHHELDISQDAALAAVKVASARRRIHPVRDYLEGLTWDEQRRAPEWLVEIMGAEDTPYTRAVGQAFLVACVARIYNPGCKVDTVPILEGDQGIGKSSTIRALVGDPWFLEMSVTDIANKDAMQILRRKWIAEMPEIDGFSKTETSHFKAYVSRQVDTYRPSYGKGTRDYPRQACFMGTTNADEYLKDETGARRFQPVKCSRGSAPHMREIRDQLWAEAVWRFKNSEEWHITDPELLDEFKRQQDARYRSDPWEQKIAGWLVDPVAVGSRSTMGVTTADVLTGAMGIEAGKWTQIDSNRAASCLRRLGWLPGKQERRNGARIRPFRPRPPLETNGVAGHVEHAPVEEEPQGAFDDMLDQM